MSGSLRQAARRLGNTLLRSQHQQRRFAGDLPAKPNQFVEALGERRENIEREFKWDARTLTNIAVFAGLVPYLIYRVTVKEFDNADAAAGRPKREMWGST
jgi:hypothetical protein